MKLNRRKCWPVLACSLVLFVIGAWWVLEPICRLFEVLIIPYYQTLNDTEQFIPRYFIARMLTGFISIMVALCAVVLVKQEYKREKQKDTQDQTARELAEKEAALAAQKAENEALKARIAELENEAQKDAESEEITSLYRELGNLEISLETSEEARQGLSHELEVKTLELVRLRQELENLKAVHGEGPKLRAMWRYVLDLEARGMADDVIWASLKNDGFSGITADALLYDGKEATFSAVKKYGEREKKAVGKMSL